MQKVKFKKSVVQGKKPSSLEAGEIAINYNAKTPFLSFQTSGDTSEIVQIAPTQSYFVKGTQTSATNAFTGELLGISELKSGLAIDYWLPYNGTSSPATLNLTISDSTGGTKTTGAIAVYAKGTTRVTTHYTASNVIHMVYTKEGGTNGRTEGWWVTSYYDTNTDSATTYNGHYTPSSSETKAYSASAGQYITGITLQRDGKGHVTGITGTTATLSDKDSYISAAAFSATAGNVTMSLTRTGSTTGTVTATIPVANSGACGVVKIITGDLQLKNYTAGEAAAAAHTHGQYSLTGHTHSQYSETGHTHTISSITGGTSGYIAKSQGASSAATWVNPTALTVGVANKLGTTTVGSTIKPIFISSGTPTACSFTIPANPLFTDSATTYAGHYTPSTGNSPTTAVTTGDALSFGNAVITGIKRDGKGHILSVTTQKLPNNPNTDSYISAAAFSATTGSGVTMSLTRTGSTTGTVTATIPAANTTSYGVVHSTITSTATTGYSVCPIINGIVYYKDTNTDSATTYNGHYTPSSSETKTYSASTGQYLTGISLQRDGKGHVTGITGTTATLSDKDSYINAATFSATTGNVKMTLTRTGSTTGTVTADIPAANSAACGVVKIITGDLQSKKYTAGEAAAAAHTHSQYSLTGHTHSQYSETGHTHSTYLKNPTASTTADTIYIVGIKTGSTQTGLYDSGVTITNASVKAKNGFFQTSDERLKTFTEDIEVDLDKLSELPKKKYYWTEDKDKVESIGTSAQKVRELFPEVVNVNEDGYLSVDYAKLSIVALAAIDELNKKNKLLEERLERLEKALLK